MNFESGFAGESLEVDESRLQQRRRLIFIVAAGLALLVAVLAIAYLSSDKQVADTSDLIPRVTVITPGSGTVSSVINATGTIAARREMPVGVVGEGGQVKAVLVEPGDWVKAGQVLARIERSVQSQQRASLAAQLQVARADARLAQNDLERAQALVSRGFVSKADIDRKTATRDAASARVRVAEAQLQEQSARLGRLDLRAPAAGLVLTRNIEPGQVVSAGNGVLFRLAKGGQMELLARMSEADLAGLYVGASASVTPVGTSLSYEGEVWQVSPVIDPQSRQGNARIALPYHKNLRPGGFASARVISGQSEAAILPESAIQNDANGSYVYIVNDDGIVERRDVKVGQVSAKGVAVSEGLSGQEKIVALAGGFLTPGQKVLPELENNKPQSK